MPGERVQIVPATGAQIWLTNEVEDDGPARHRAEVAGRGGTSQRRMDTSSEPYRKRDVPCRLCGGRTPFEGAVTHNDGWRSHAEHGTERPPEIAAAVLAGVLGRKLNANVTGADALLLLEDKKLPLPYFAIATANDGPPVEPWAWVSRGQRRDLLRAIVDRLPTLRAQAAGGALTTCTAGPCGICGTVAAVGWVETPHGPLWPSGGAVPLCSSCWQVHANTTMDDAGWDAFTRSTIRAATGVLVHDHEVRQFYVPPFGRDHERDDPTAGEPWAYLDADALRALRLTLYLSRSTTSTEVPEPWRPVVARERARRNAQQRLRTTDTADRALALAQLAAAGHSTTEMGTPAAPVRGWFT